MRRKAMTIGVMVGALSLVAAGSWFLLHQRHQWEVNERAGRERRYQTTLAQYLVQLRPGMTRDKVERYLHSKNIAFTQTCCVALYSGQKVSFDREGYDDLVKIGEENPPWACGENNVYIALEFNPKSSGEPSGTNASDTLKRISVHHQLERCM